jgi:predicted permease
MKLLYSLRAFLAFVFRRPGVEQEMDEELRSHLQIRADDLARQGLSRAEAERQARLEFGGYERYKEECRDALASRLFQELLADVRYALRQLRRNPGFTAVAVLTLGLGIGANTAIFSVVNAILIRPLPYRSPDQLVHIWETDLKSQTSQVPPSYPDFRDWRAQNHVFEAMAAYNWATFTLTGSKEPMHVSGLITSANLFSLLGAKPALGRLFLPEEEQPGQRVVILSHHVWRQQFNSDPGVLGRTVQLNRMGFVVVGVMPAGFQFPIQAEPMDLWVARGIDSEVPNRDSHYFEVMARLGPQVTLQQARAEMATIAARLAREYPKSDRDVTVKLVPEHQQLVGGVRAAVLILFSTVLLVLLIACANVANLLMARATRREGEIAVRAALGAGQRRLVRQLLTESFLLSVLSGALGLFLGWWGTRWLVRLGPPDTPRLAEISLDPRVLAFTLVSILLTGVIFGLAPALRAAKTNLIESLKTGRAAQDGSHWRRLRSALVVSEVALTLILLAGAGLLINSLFRLSRVNLGFKPNHVLTFAVGLSDADYTPARAAARLDQLLVKIRHTPGVSSAAADTNIPLSGIEVTYVGFQMEGQATSEWHMAAFSIVSPDFFRTLGIKMLEGRDFAATDDLKALPVVIVSESLARRYFPGQDAIGKRIKSGYNAGDEMPLRQIIAVVADIRRDSLTDEPPHAFYLPVGQMPEGSMRFLVRSAISPLGFVDSMRAAVGSVNKDVPVYDITTLDQYLGLALAQRRFNTLLLGLFATLAVLLSAVGLYGVISFSVGQRIHEFGIRMALGAARGELIAMVLREGLSLVLIGIGIGLVGALALTRFLSSQLYGVKPTDPLTFVAASAVFAAIAWLANYIPARRATKVDPMEALRYE